MVFISRQVKASWGLPCNQKSDGTLWAGKGYQKPLVGQFGTKEVAAIKKALAKVRGNRNGRFWVDFEDRKVTMAVREAADNEYDEAPF